MTMSITPENYCHEHDKQKTKLIQNKDNYLLIP